MLVLVTFSAEAGRVLVRSLPEFQSAIDAAVPGDMIVLAKGVYTATESIVVRKAGTAANPITIAAEIPGETEITGKGGINIVSPAAYVQISGFRFTHKASMTRTGIGTSFCRFSHNLFEESGDGEYLLLAGSDHEVGYNTFQHKNSMGRFIAVRGQGNQIAERLWIHHNYFYDFQPQTGNGAEAFQFGLSGFSMSYSNSVVEYNLFEGCAGEAELISVKASGVELRYNTIRNCKAQFTLRHGNKCKVYGNYFTGTPGLRIFGDDHAVFSNYFEGCSKGIDIGNGDGEVADGSPLTCHDRPDRVLVAFNTLVDNKENIVMSPRKDGMGATAVTIAYNIIQGGSDGAVITGPYPAAEWKGNLLFRVANGGKDMPASGYTVTDPGLVKNASGIWHIQKRNPASGVAGEVYAAIIADMDGQKRTLPLDAGADQFSDAPVVVHLLAATEVGVNAGK